MVLHFFAVIIQQANCTAAYPPVAARTAPVSSMVHFPFDIPASPKSVRSIEKNQSLFTFGEGSLQQKQINEFAASTACKDDEEENKRHANQSKYLLSKENVSLLKQANDVNEKIIADGEDSNKKGSGDISLKSRNRFLTSIKNMSSTKEKNTSNSKLNSAPAASTKRDSNVYDSSSFSQTDTTMFPFDRESIDYERIQRECFAVEPSPLLPNSEFPFSYEPDNISYDEDSPIYDKSYFESPIHRNGSKANERYQIDTIGSNIFEQYQMIAQQESFQLYEKRSYRRNNSLHQKYENLSELDAFSPRPSDKLKKMSDIHHHQHKQLSVSKFEQIATKFNQIPPKSLDAFNNQNNQHERHHSHHHYTKPHHYHQYQSAALPSQPSSSSGSVNLTRETPPLLPNLRVDFFAETNVDDTLDICQKTLASTAAATVLVGETLTTSVAGTTTNSASAGAINVTPNPMDTAVCTQPRATIVVQQVRDI